MNLTALVAQLRLHEGVRDRPYRCTAGKLTVGVGRNIDDVPFSADEIDLMLANDVQKCVRYALQYPWYNGLSDAHQNVVLNLIFNLGPARFAGFRKFHSAMERGDWAGAVAELDNSKWQEQVDPVLGDGKGRADVLMTQLLQNQLP